MKMISLFSGIGGIDLGAEKAGVKTILQCDNSPFCQTILKKHWPGVPLIGDVKDVNLSLFVPGSLARMRARQIVPEKELKAKELVMDGMKRIELFATFDLNTFFWRTLQISLEKDGQKLLQNFPRQGIVSGGELYLLKTTGSRLRVNGFTPLLSRPVASDGKRFNCSRSALMKRYKGTKHKITLPELMQSRFGLKITPSFYEKIMGFQQGHTELPPLAMRVFPFSLKS